MTETKSIEEKAAAYDRIQENHKTKTEKLITDAAKYNRVERVADKRGRIIGVKRLKFSQQIKVEEMSPGLEGVTKVKGTDADGIEREMEVTRRMPLHMAASVCEIDGHPLTFPKTRAELDAVLDMLDEEGMAAVMEAFAKLSQGSEEVPGGDIIDQAKN